VRCDLLRVLQGTIVLEVGGEAGRPGSVAAYLRRDVGGAGAPADHSPRIGLTHRLEWKWPTLSGRQRSEMGTGGLVADAGGTDVRIKVLLKRVVDWHHVFLAALHVQPELPALPLGEVVVDFQGDRRADAGERVNERTDESAIVQILDHIGIDRVQKLSRLLAREDRRLAALYDVLLSVDGMRRVGRHDSADHKPIKEHPDCRELLFDAGLRVGKSALLDEGGDDRRGDAVDIVDPSRVAPAKEVTDGPTVGPARVSVPDVGGEELDEAPGGAVASSGNERRDLVEAGLGRLSIGGDGGIQRV